MSFGMERFGETTFGVGSMIDLYWNALPKYYHGIDGKEELKRFLQICGEISDEIKVYAERIWWLYDAYKCRADLLKTLAKNFGIDVSDADKNFLRRLIEYVGYFAKRKGTIKAINDILNMLGWDVQLRAEDLYEVSKLPGDIENNKSLFVLRYGDKAVYGENEFLYGAWKYTYGSLGWFNSSQVQEIPNGCKKITGELQTPEPDFNGVETKFDGELAHKPIYEQSVVFRLYDNNNNLKDSIWDIGQYKHGKYNLVGKKVKGILDYINSKWKLYFDEAPLSTDNLISDYYYGLRQIYPVSLIRIYSSAELGREQINIIKSLCGLCLPAYVYVTDIHKEQEP